LANQKSQQKTKIMKKEKKTKKHGSSEHHNKFNIVTEKSGLNLWTVLRFVS